MSDALRELDEAIEKAGKVTFRGKRMSRAQRRKDAAGKGGESNLQRRGGRLILRAGMGWRYGAQVRKSTDPVDTLYTEIEKARGLIRGGSTRTARGLGKKLKGLHGRLDSGKLRLGDGIKGQRLERAVSYLRDRKSGGQLNATSKKKFGFRVRGGAGARSGRYK